MYSPYEKKPIIGIKGIIIIIILGIFIYHINKEEVVEYGPGVKVSNEPIQNDIYLKDSFKFKGYDVEKLASYEIEAKVLSRKDYSDMGSKFSPTDLALGWGHMSDESVLETLNISQSGRWYRWRSKTTTLPISINEVKYSSANTHIIPANELVKENLKNVKKGSIIKMKGYLVKITGENGYIWKSSTTRRDSGAGACEIFYVERLDL